MLTRRQVERFRDVSGDTLAAELGVNENTVYKWARRYGIEARSKVGPRNSGRRWNPVAQDLADAIVKAVSDDFDVSPEDIYGRCREADIAHARHVCCWLAHRAFGYSLPATAEAMRRGDHTTVLNSVRRIDHKRHKSVGYALRIDAIASTVGVA